MLSGRYLGGRFGFAIAKAGDLDGDSFDGVLFVYMAWWWKYVSVCQMS